MSKSDHSNERTDLPLTEAALRETESVPERHHLKRAMSQTARFDLALASDNDQPVVTTRLVRKHGCGRSSTPMGAAPTTTCATPGAA